MKKNVLGLLMAGLAILAANPGYAEITTLAPVVVTATRTPKTISRVAASIAVITAEEIAATGATRLDEVLRDVVGLQIVSNGPAGAVATPSIRGSESAQVLVLLNGVRLNSPQLGLFNLSDLPVALGEIERIEVLRGPASALYGSNALGGVIQIFTRAPEADPLTFFSWSEGRFDTRSLNFSTAHKKDGVRYRLGAGLERSQGFRENSDLDQFNLEGMFGFDLGTDFDLEVSAYHLDKEIGVPGSTTFLSPLARQEDKNTLATLTLSGPVGPVALTVRGIYERSRNQYEDPDAFPPADDTHLVETFGAELQGELQNGSHSLLFGSDFYRDELDSTALGKLDENRWSLFSQYEIEATSWSTLLLGLRYDAHSDFNNELSPRAAVLFSLTETTRLRASASKAFRAPTLNDRFWPDTGWTKGNPDLDPETAWEYEMALDQGLSTWGDLSLAVFQRDAEDLITWQEVSPFVWSPVNVNKARIWGTEAEIDLRLNQLFGAGANYTYLHPKDRATDKYIAGKPKHQAHLYLEIGPVKEFRLRLDGRYVRNYSQSSQKDNNYTVVDAALTRPLTLNNSLDLKCSITVKNLFDKEYEVSSGYPMPPRELFVSITAYF